MLNDGQAIAIVAAGCTLAGTVIAVLKDKYGKRLDREGTKEVRQSAIESNLWLQLQDAHRRIDDNVKFYNERMDKLEADKDAMELRLRAEFDLRHRDCESHLEALKKEVEELRRQNTLLAQHNMLLQHGIGVSESTPAGNLVARYMHALETGQAVQPDLQQAITQMIRAGGGPTAHDRAEETGET